MQIGQIIRKYRKQKDMTQEEMANRLGVTAPAVNKWENGNSYPDITLLAPLARLLDISLDTLLSFREELTTEEIQDIVYTVNSMLREKSFEEAFEWAKEKIQQYPNCEVMILEVAVLLNAAHMRTENDGVECDRSNDGQQDSEDSGADRSNRRQERQNATENISEEQGTRQQDQEYDQYITRWFSDSLKSEREQIRTMAADALFAFYLSKKQYDKAEKCLEYYSEQNPERGSKQALIYSRTGRTEEAYRTYEELLFAAYQRTSILFNGIYMLAAQDQNMDKARSMLEKQSALAAIFEMGRYHQVSGRLELAIIEQNVEESIAIVKEMLDSLDEINGFINAPLYEHMTFREPRKESIEQIREDLLNGFRNDESCGFLKDDSRWQELIG